MTESDWGSLRAKSCCCVFSIKFGCYLIGILHIVGIYLGVVNSDQVRMVLEMFTCMAYANMVIIDIEQNRKIFWIVYSCYIPAITLYQLFYWFFPLNADHERWHKEIDEYCTWFG